MTFIVPSRVPSLPTSSTSVSGFVGSFGVSSGSGSGGGVFNPSVNANLNIKFPDTATLNIGFGGGSGKPPGSSSTRLNSSSGSGKDSGSGGGGCGEPPRGGRPRRGGNSASKGSAHYPLKDRPVLKTDWNSGILSGTLINPYIVGDEDYSPLYILNGQFFPDVKNTTGKDGIKINKGSQFSEMFDSDIFNPYLRASERAINYRVGDDFSSEDLFEYIYNVSSALQLFYMIDSIIAYVNNGANRNRGLRYLRDLLTAEILSSHERLRLTLESLPIPRNLVDFIRFMYQNFSHSDKPDSPVIRLGYSGSLYYCSSADAGKLSNLAYSKVQTKLDNLGKIVPIMNKILNNTGVNELPPSCDIAIYDEQFLTFWHNSNVSFSDKERKLVHSREANDFDQQHYYAHYPTELDGGIYACCSLVINNISEPGIWKSFADFEDDWDYEDRTSLTVYKRGGIVGCGDIALRMGSGIYSAPYFNGSWVLLTGPAPGVLKTQVHCVGNTTQAVSAMIRSLVSFEGK